MKLVKELIITLLFLALYTPLSIAIWYATGKAANLLIVGLVGMSIIAAYLYIQIARYELGWRIKALLRRRFRRTYITIDEEPEIEDEPDDCDYEDMTGFRALFSPKNMHGGVAQ